MNKSLKAALLSALIYPGVGHLSLKRYISALVFIIGFSIPMILLFKKIMEKANQVVAQIEHGQIGMDVSSLSNALNTSAAGSMQMLDVYSYLMLAVWLIALLDIYRVRNH
ncbi:hypothetical protein [Psychromonas sp. 14N.309.X.WAT.B.A12]|uniref:hypothetical protein n=1 Tax=unclassified Psychromonas TaxID=2614957 RepID=UPI0025B21ECB|nr:hypothetical protein [Psychromonas sp. 14N.309.X.WAT.B.A12]MDN2663415.1 hypothetical protein [Psychromonas sp. 14N.309.X.WAT.B.A12]